MSEEFPFVQTKLSENKALRTFNESVNNAELIWHMDREDRIITVLESDSWKLQMDNELPEVLKVGNEYNIPKMVYHRLHKGEGRLIIDIKEYEEKK